MTQRRPSAYRSLTEPPAKLPEPKQAQPEEILDTLLTGLNRCKPNQDLADGNSIDPIQNLRGITLNELVPTFVELVEKYSETGISMQMDASSFLEGGREIKLEFGLQGYRIQMLGTVTTEAIAFHETRYSPNRNGELLSGPMLRLRGLNGEVFRQFICERLTLLIREVLGRK